MIIIKIINNETINIFLDCLDLDCPFKNIDVMHENPRLDIIEISTKLREM
jgi:hypothetical protein